MKLLPPALLVIFAGAACLPDGEPVNGRLIFPGTAVETPALQACDSADPSVTLAVRKSALVGGGGGFYYLAGDDRVLTRVPGVQGEAQVLRPRVSRYLLRDDERVAVVALSDGDQVHTVVLDLMTGAETPLPVDNPCCWIGFD